MTLPDQTETPSSDELTARVRAVDGVADIFTPIGNVAHIPKVVTALVAGEPQRLSTVAVSNGDTSVSVTARIGTHHNASTPDTACDVADVLLESIGANTDAIIHVQVVRIHESLTG